MLTLTLVSPHRSFSYLTVGSASRPGKRGPAFEPWLFSVSCCASNQAKYLAHRLCWNFHTILCPSQTVNNTSSELTALSTILTQQTTTSPSCKPQLTLDVASTTPLASRSPLDLFRLLLRCLSSRSVRALSSSVGRVTSEWAEHRCLAVMLPLRAA